MGMWLKIAQIGAGFLGSMQEQKGIKDQYNAERKEFERQQEEANLRAREERSDRVRERDRAAAAAMVAFEAIGGAGSQNAERRDAEIAGTAALDLARISGNQRRELASLYSRAKAAQKTASGAIRQSQTNFMNSALSIGGDLLKEEPTSTQATSAGGGASSYTPKGGSYGGATSAKSAGASPF